MIAGVSKESKERWVGEGPLKIEELKIDVMIGPNDFTKCSLVVHVKKGNLC